MRILSQDKTTSWPINSLGTIRAVNSRLVGMRRNQPVVIAIYASDEEAKVVLAKMMASLAKKEPVFILPKAVLQEEIPFEQHKN